MSKPLLLRFLFFKFCNLLVSGIWKIHHSVNLSALTKPFLQKFPALIFRGGIQTILGQSIFSFDFQFIINHPGLCIIYLCVYLSFVLPSFWDRFLFYQLIGTDLWESFSADCSSLVLSCSSRSRKFSVSSSLILRQDTFNNIYLYLRYVCELIGFREMVSFQSVTHHQI